MNLAVFISGGGTNLQALLDGEKNKIFQSTIAMVLSSNPHAYGLKRGERAGVPTFVSKDEKEIYNLCVAHRIDGIVLAGYLNILGPDLLEPYKDRILNIHPSLLPKYGGVGMYGIRVHEKVFEHGVKISGATVHLVNEVVDGGRIILQESVDISDCKSPEEIQKRVLEVEHKIYPKGIKIWEENNEACFN